MSILMDCLSPEMGGRGASLSQYSGHWAGEVASGLGWPLPAWNFHTSSDLRVKVIRAPVFSACHAWAETPPWEWRLGEEGHSWPLSHIYQEFSVCNSEWEGIKNASNLCLRVKYCISWLRVQERRSPIFLAILMWNAVPVKRCWVW